MKLQFKKIKGLSIAILTLALVGCPNPAKDPKKSTAVPQSELPPQQNVSSVDTKTATCEEKMRPLIEKNEIAFQSVPAFQEEIKAIQQGQSEASLNKIMSVHERNSQYISYSVKTDFKSASNKGQRYSKLGLNEKGAATPLYIELGGELKTKTKSISLSQRYILETTSADCEMKLSQTTLAVIERKTSETYRFKRVSLAYDGAVTEDKSAELQLNTDEVLSEFGDDDVSMEEIDNQKAKKKVMTYYIGMKAALQMAIQLEGSVQEVAFGQKINFKNYKVISGVGTKYPKTSIYRYSESPKISVNLLYNKDRYWTLPFADFFNRIHLGQPQASTELISHLTIDYQKSSDLIRLKTVKKLDYENLGAYWTILKADERSDEIVYDLQAKKVPVTDGKFIPADLASNATIQTDLPEIQKIAAEIKKSAGDDRKKILQGILSHLKNNYKYDQEMLKRNVIRPLTTKEALDRKQGVCQHYAVIYTALARALSIPTRIIAGFYIPNGEVVYHAWVESEIESGKWQVIEPQAEDGLTDTIVKLYVPLFRATFLEDRDVDLADHIEIFSDNTFEFSPLTK